LFDIDAPQELTNCIDELLTDPDFRERLGKAAKKRFDTHFSPESLTAKLEDTFIKTLNKNLQTV
jgi:glycosyltransferase involved in cell wall biosynthesis